MSLLFRGRYVVVTALNNNKDSSFSWRRVEYNTAERAVERERGGETLDRVKEWERRWRQEGERRVQEMRRSFPPPGTVISPRFLFTFLSSPSFSTRRIFSGRRAPIPTQPLRDPLINLATSRGTFSSGEPWMEYLFEQSH